MKANIILIGGGGHCKSCIDVILTESKYNIIGITDLENNVGSKVLDYRIISSDDKIQELIKQFDPFFLITLGQIGSAEKRKSLYKKVKELGGKFATIVSPNAYVSDSATLGEGTIIMHGAIVNASATIGVNSIINSASLIEHDAQIGDHCHIATKAVINGGVIVGHESFVGSGAITKQYITVKEKSFIKAGSIFKG